VSWVPLYDALAVDYDRFVSWEGRLAHELPFFLGLFQEHGVQRVLDAACGTGHHAIALARRGYQVLGADLSAAMVERARENAVAAGFRPADADLAFAVAGFGQLTSLGRAKAGAGFDAVLCLGNSLPHLLTAEKVDHALRDFAAVLRPGGLLLIQNRNFERVWTERERFMPPQSVREGDDEWVFVRFYDFHQETITFNMVRLRRAGEGWTQAVESTELRPIFQDDLAASLTAAGLGHFTFHGSYDGTAFDPAQSGDLIAVARKG
jgi:glycine/sarcosine N-methyltransferase